MEAEEKKTLNITEIQKILPHRHPFLLLDTVTDLVPGVSAVGHKAVTYTEPFFAGHFPGNPVMPGVLIIEAMAQTGAVALLGLPQWKGKTAYFVGIDKAKFSRKVVPGDVLMFEVNIIKPKGPFGIAEAVAKVDGETAAKAELTFAVGE